MNKEKLAFIGSIIGFVICFFIGSFLYKSYEENRLGFLAQENVNLFVRDYSPQYGSKDAKVFVTEFLDPECESCRQFYPQVKSLLAKYEGKVKLVVRYAAFHHNSAIAIAALEAARNQDKYWESLEILFQFQPIWGSHQNPKPELIFDYLPQVGVDITKLKEDMKDPKIQDIIAQDNADLRELNVRGTPTFFVNGKPLVNFGMQYLEEAIKTEIKKYY